MNMCVVHSKDWLSCHVSQDVPQCNFSTLLHTNLTEQLLPSKWSFSCVYSISQAISPYSQVCFTPQPMALSQPRFPDADPFEAGEKELTRDEK